MTTRNASKLIKLDASSYGVELTVYPCGECGHARDAHNGNAEGMCVKCQCAGWTPKLPDNVPKDVSTSADLRNLIELFPRDFSLHRKFLLSIADELDMLHRDMTEAATRIGLQSDLLSRQKNAAKRCFEIAKEEAETYQRHANDYPTNGAAAVACRRIADRIESEVVVP